MGDVLHVPVKNSQEPCSECGKPATAEVPNLEYTLVGISGVLCRVCIEREVAGINGKLQEQQ